MRPCCATLPSDGFREDVLRDLVERAVRSERPDDAFRAALTAAASDYQVAKTLADIVWEDKSWTCKALETAEEAARRVPDPKDRDRALVAVVAAYEQANEPERARAAAALTATESREEAARFLARAAARESDVARAWRLVQSITDWFRREWASSDVAEELAALGRFSEAASFARARLRPAQDLARVALCAAGW
jgi:hypothetical protein